MKNSPLTTILLILAVIAALSSVGLCYLYLSNARDLRVAQAKVAQVNQNRMIMQALLGEAVEYSKRNPALEPILESAGVKLKPTSPSK